MCASLEGSVETVRKDMVSEHESEFKKISLLRDELQGTLEQVQQNLQSSQAELSNSVCDSHFSKENLTRYRSKELRS